MRLLLAIAACALLGGAAVSIWFGPWQSPIPAPDAVEPILDSLTRRQPSSSEITPRTTLEPNLVALNSSDQDGTLPDIDTSKAHSRLQTTKDPDEWAVANVDIAFYHVFQQLRDRPPEAAAPFDLDEVNPRGLELSQDEDARLQELLSDLCKEISQAECFYEVERYEAFRQSVARPHVSFPNVAITTAAEMRKSEREQTIRRMQELAGGPQDFEYVIVSDYPEGGVPQTREESLALLRQRKASPPLQRLLYLTRRDDPLVFKAKDELSRLRDRHLEAVRSFYAGLYR